MTYVMSQLLPQLWYSFTWRLYLGDFYIHASPGTPSTWGDRRRGKQFSFFITECIRGPGSPDLPLSVKRAMRAYFPSPGSSPPQTQRGEGQFCIFAQLCFPRFTQTGKAASQNCQPELEIARMGKVGRDFMPKFEV